MSKPYLGFVCAVLLVLVFWLDHATPHYFVPAVLYTVPVCLSTFVKSLRFTYGLTLAAIVAIALEGYLDSVAPHFDTALNIPNRAAAGLAVVLVSFLSVSLQQAILRIEDRNVQLQALNANLQELARVNRVTLMGQMTASIVHEINQPLTGIASNAGTSLRYLAASDQDAARQYLELIVRDVRRAAEIVGKVRGLARGAPLKTRLMDLNDAIVDAIALVQGQLDSHGTRLRLELSGELPQIPGDRIQLQQVLLNLIVNAMEAMDDVKDREPTIVVASGRADADHVFVEVRDCGPGLDPEDRARLFNPFYTTKPEGMGMGLSISRLIIEGHRGDLRALPNVPHGAVFRITLPRNEVEA